MTITRAEVAGQLSEDMIAAVLKINGCVFERQVVVGRTVMDKRWRVDFLIHNIREYPTGLILQAKSQHKPGSVDEKFFYLLDCIRRAPYPTIVVAHGRRIRRAAAWLRSQCDPEHLIAVLDFEEFVSWLREITIE